MDIPYNGRLFYLVLVLLLLCNSDLVFSSSALKDIGLTQPKVKMPAPEFCLESLSEDKKCLSDFKGKIVLINFWATFCSPCRQEMPSLESLWQAHESDGFVVLAVSADKGQVKKVEEFVNSIELTFPVLLDDKGGVRKDYEVVGLPTTYLISSEGLILGRMMGDKDWNSAKVHTLIESLARP